MLFSFCLSEPATPSFIAALRLYRTDITSRISDTGLVMALQFRYQRAKLYREVAMGEKHHMTVSQGGQQVPYKGVAQAPWPVLTQCALGSGAWEQEADSECLTKSQLTPLLSETASGLKKRLVMCLLGIYVSSETSSCPVLCTKFSVVLVNQKY